MLFPRSEKDTLSIKNKNKSKTSLCLSTKIENLVQEDRRGKNQNLRTDKIPNPLMHAEGILANAP